MLLGFTGDWQIDSRPYCDRLDELGRSIRFKENIDHIKLIMDELYAAGVRILIHLGDMGERRNLNSAEQDACAILFRYWLDKSDDCCIEIIAGNHDGNKFEVSSSTMAPLARMAGNRMRAHHDISRVGLLPQGDKLVSMTAIPYQHHMSLEEVTRQHKALGKPTADINILVMHYDVTGAQVGAKNLVLPGDKLGKDQLLLEQYDFAGAGHIHKQQKVKIGKNWVFFPGSPYQVDHGERNDPKGYALYDTETGEGKLVEVAPPRTWSQAAWPLDLLVAPWSEGDVVKIQGEFPAGTRPKDEVDKLIADGSVPEPFFIRWDIHLENVARVSRSEEVAQATSLVEAASTLAQERLTDVKPAEQKKILEIIQEHLDESQRTKFSEVVRPVLLILKNFMSIGYAEIRFINGEPVLICGPNGLGKTNVIEAILFAFTGQISKRLNISSLLRRGADEGEVRLLLAGHQETDELSIERTLKRSAKGVTHKLNVYVDYQGEKVEWAQGTIKDVQEALNASLGLSFESLRATNFMFQQDSDPFVTTEPLRRKKVLGEILNHGPISKAAKDMNKKRLDHQHALTESQGVLKGLNDVVLNQEQFDGLESAVKLGGDAVPTPSWP